MNSIYIKITHRELVILVAFLEQVLSAEKPKSHMDKLLHTCLAELLHKLKMVSMFVKKEYRIQVKRSWGHALVHFCTTRTFRSISDYRIVINNMISLIDQKTAA